MIGRLSGRTLIMRFFTFFCFDMVSVGLYDFTHQFRFQSLDFVTHKLNIHNWNGKFTGFYDVIANSLDSEKKTIQTINIIQLFSNYFKTTNNFMIKRIFPVHKIVWIDNLTVYFSSRCKFHSNTSVFTRF